MYSNVNQALFCKPISFDVQLSESVTFPQLCDRGLLLSVSSKRVVCRDLFCDKSKFYIYKQSVFITTLSQHTCKLSTLCYLDIACIAWWGTRLLTLCGFPCAVRIIAFQMLNLDLSTSYLFLFLSFLTFEGRRSLNWITRTRSNLKKFNVGQYILT